MERHFSVIIPTFNRAKLVCEAILSVLNQSYRNFEVIVVDDGSTDTTKSALEEFGSRIRYIQQGNSGQGIARERGVLESKNEWIALCDSDDLWKPSYLASVNTLLSERPNTLLTFANFDFFDGEAFYGNKFESAPQDFFSDCESCQSVDALWSSKPLTAKLMQFQPIFTTATTFLKKHLYEVGGYDREFARTYSEDLEPTLRLVSQGRIGVLTHPLVSIRKHRDNFSSNRLKVLQGEARILEYSASNSFFPIEISRMLRSESSRRFVSAARESFDRRQFSECMACYLKSGLQFLSIKDIGKLAVSVGAAAFCRRSNP